MNTRSPIVVTGASGFLAKHIVRQLLQAGYSVRATLRTPGRSDEVRAAVLPGLDPEAGERLTFATVDLTRDEGWADAMQGASALIHTASPFPIAQPKDENELVRPAVDGTLRALRAARDAGVMRVILTSSVAAVLKPGQEQHDESDWADPDAETTNPYQKSKILAEKAAWDFVANEAPDLQLTVINPSLILGPPLDQHYGSSIDVVKRIVSGRDPMLPKVAFELVDVRDVATMHIRALERPTTAGKRYIGAGGCMLMPDMGKSLKEVYPRKRIATRAAPVFAIRLLALVDDAAAAVLKSLGKPQYCSSERARTELGIDFIPAEEALRASAAALV